MIHAQRTNRPFVQRGLPVNPHPFEVQGKAVLEEMLDENSNKHPIRQNIKQNQTYERNAISKDVKETHMSVNALALHPMILQ